MSVFKTLTKNNFRTVCDHLGRQDKDIAAILKAHNYPRFLYRPNTFDTLVHFILEQQVSVAAALAAANKLKERIGAIIPSEVLKLNDFEMRACYISGQKTRYIRGIAEAIQNGHLDLDALKKLPDEEVRRQLTALKGIGNWTADVYLMFVLRRTDVFPIGDLAAVNAAKRLKSLPREAGQEHVLKVTEQWAPYRTAAAIILWHHYHADPIKRVKAA